MHYAESFQQNSSVTFIMFLSINKPQTKTSALLRLVFLTYMFIILLLTNTQHEEVLWRRKKVEKCDNNNIGGEGIGDTQPKHTNKESELG